MGVRGYLFTRAIFISSDAVWTGRSEPGCLSVAILTWG